MSMPKIIVPVLVLLLLAAAFAMPPSVTPHKSPELLISNPSDPSGKTTLLSNLKGKVVVLEFWFIQSEHCVRVAKMLNKLNSELAPRGFQALGVVFDPPNIRAESAGRFIQPTVNYLKLGYPVGYASKAVVDAYLGRSGKQILTIPQVVVIDRSGFIRAVSGDHVDPNLEDENSLRTLLDGLLKENPPPPATHTKTPAASKKTR